MALTAILALVLIGALAGHGGNATKSAASSTKSVPSASQASPSPAATYSPAPVPSPDGTFTNSCDYVLGDFSSYTSTGYRFIAQANLNNTGNIGINVRVVASWDQVGTSSIVRKKVVGLKPGQEKTLNFTVPVGQNEIDLIQAVAIGQDDCKVTATITGTWGAVQG